MAEQTQKGKEELVALAGEYALGVLDAEERRSFERLAKDDSELRAELENWQMRLHGLDTAYAEVPPPASLKARLDARLFPQADEAKQQVSAGAGGLWNALGFWRGLGIVASLAFIALGIYNTQILGRVSVLDSQLAEMRSNLEQSREITAALESQLADAKQVAQTAEDELSQANTNVAALRDEVEKARSSEQPVLVVSLESGDTDYRFLAVHEEGTERVRMTLVSGGPASADQDFELWLVEPERDTVSLGVIDSGKTAIELNREQARILEAGGLLAVSLEQKGGSPTGVAQGPVLAVGVPQKL